jgi:phage baseplate assembly protein gpV
MNNMKTRMIAVCFFVASLAVWLVPLSAAGAQADKEKEFSDVSADHWAYEAVKSMIRYGVVDGYEDGSFQPDALLTREQFTKLLTLALDLELPEVPEPTFSDVEGDRWSLKYVEAVRDYLEGYHLPIGKPFYEPSATVTREDVAVALVKGMKIDLDAVKDPVALIENTFYDFWEVSDGYEPFIAAAIENKLLAGYPDGTFRPKDGLNRGAAMTLLHRLLQSPMMPKMKDIGLTVKMSSEVQSPYVAISGTIDAGLRLYVDDREVDPSNGKFDTGEQLEDQEGNRDITVKAVKANGRYKSITRSVSFLPPAPQLSVVAPETTEKQMIRLSGKISDSNDDAPGLFINGEPVEISGGGSWSYEAALAEGNNTITVKASNKYGKETSVQKSTRFTVKPPAIKLENIPETVHFADLTIQGSVTDINDNSPSVTVNGTTVTPGSFRQSLRLTEGVNDIRIRATNHLGKKEEINKKVQYVIKPPEIEVKDLQESVVFDKADIQVTVADLYDKQPSLYVNNSYVGKGTYSGRLTFKEGENLIPFKAVSSSGKETTLYKKVIYMILPPNLQVEPLPAVAASKSIKVLATANEIYGGSVSLYVNGTYAGTNSIERNVTLTEGENTITVRAVNSKSKEMVFIHKITYTSPAPVLTVDPIPDSVTSNRLSIKARATDVNDSYPRLYLNSRDMGYTSLDTTMTLTEGSNAIEIKATNSAGKITTFTKTVVYEIPAPVITVEALPETTAQATITVRVSASDPNDSSPTIYINGQVSGSSSISKTVTLVPGENTFEIKATNRSGKISTTTVKVTRIETPALQGASPAAIQPPPAL